MLQSPKTLMKKYIEDKWLWNDFCTYYTNISLESKVYVSSWKDKRNERKEKCKELYREWKTYREIWKSFNPPISYQTAYNDINL